MYDIYRRRGITNAESLKIMGAYQIWFLSQLEEREGRFYEEAKELIECNAIVRSIDTIRAHLEEIGKLPKE